MNKYNIAKNHTNQKLQALEADIQHVRKQSNTLEKRRAALVKRQENLAKIHGGSHVQASDIIKLNVGGRKMYVLRETLTLIKGSRLEVLFSGRWENKLLRDEEDNVFIDVDPYYFKKVLEYLYLVKVVKTKRTPDKVDHGSLLPKIKDEYEKVVFDLYMSFFRLQDGDCGLCVTKVDGSNTNNDAASHCSYKDLLDTFEVEKKELHDVQKHLDEMEAKLSVEEDFVSYFTNNEEGEQSIDDSSKTSYDDMSFTSMTSDLDSSVSAPSTSTSEDNDEEKNKNALANNTILKLWLDGEIIPVKYSTMCAYQKSQLAFNFKDEKWLEKHHFEYEEGKKAILMEYSSPVFKSLINHLRLKSMMSCLDDEEEVPPMKLKMDHNNKHDDCVDNVVIESTVSALLDGDEEFELQTKCSMDSTIVNSSEDENQIMSWLEEVNRKSKPELLYRASKDGWRASDFHSKCDDKGSTLVIVKSEEGFVFGGYSDQSWRGNYGYKSSNESFLFSLKCHAGLAPIKMKIKNGKTGKAIYAYSSYGPTFGGGHDLCVGCNNSDLKSGCTNLNSTYQLPSGASQTFLTGKQGSANPFKVAEVEVYKV